MSAAFDDILRFGPVIVLLVSATWLALATRRVSRAIGGRAYGFGKSRRQQVARLLFAGSLGGAAVTLTAHAAGVASTPVTPLADATALRLAGLAFAVSGQVVTLVAQEQMGRRWRVGVPGRGPDALVTTGLFGFSRNPVFFGMLAMAVGLAVAVPAPAMIVLASAFFVACEMQVRDEERFLSTSFGEAYLSYARAVPRWIWR